MSESVILELQFLPLIFDFFFFKLLQSSHSNYIQAWRKKVETNGISLCEAKSIYSTSDTSELPKL